MYPVQPVSIKKNGPKAPLGSSVPKGWKIVEQFGRLYYVKEGPQGYSVTVTEKYREASS